MSNPIDIKISRKVFLPHYQHLLDSDADIDFLWGGRDTGKSYFVGQKLLIDCMTLPYFRGILIKKVGESIKDSQFEVLRSIIERWKLGNLFRLTTSPLEIKCINGNKFIARGCDNPEKMKSIADPTHAWFEESDQLTREEIIVITTTLRSNNAKVKQYHSFNPESKGDYKKHWVYPYMAEHYERGVFSFNGEMTIQIPNEEPYVLKYTSTHGTYKNNPYCKPERKAALEQLKIIDPYYYRVYTLGLFGNQLNERPFVLSYKPDKHNGYPELNRDEVVYLSFDFNKDPMCCSVIQHYDGLVRILRTIKIANSDIYEMCEYIMALYSGCYFQVTGDASGASRSALVRDNLNYYSVIMEVLNLNVIHLDIPTCNPSLKENRMLVNAVLATYPVTLHTDDAAHMIYDFLHVKSNSDGSIEKGNRNDPDQQADALDTWRYFCNTYMKPYISYEGH